MAMMWRAGRKAYRRLIYATGIAIEKGNPRTTAALCCNQRPAFGVLVLATSRWERGHAKLFTNISFAPSSECDLVSLRGLNRPAAAVISKQGLRRVIKR
jgi:hypothetical protein